MDFPVTRGGSRPTSERRTDLVDVSQKVEVNTSGKNDIRSRPHSHQVQNQVDALPAPDSDTAQGSRDVFKRVAFSELRIPSMEANNMDVIAAATPPLLPPSSGFASANEKGTDPFLSANQSDVERPSAPSKPRDTARPPAVARKTTSVSRLCFPFVTTSSRRKPKPPPSPPPARHKYSCFPSLLSPVPAGRPSPTHQRHSYRQHGYSRQALEHTKWFWSMREGELDGKPNGHERKAYGVISPTVHPSARAGCSTPVPASQPSTPPVTIHPRRGDIAALRDPYSMHVDRCFAGLPTWTIGKTLWMHDLHLAAEKRRSRLHITLDYDSSDAGSESEMDASTSTGFSDDSDATLVESECESDLTRLAARSRSGVFTAQDDDDMDAHDNFIASSSSSTTPSITPLPSPTLSPSIDRLVLDKANWLLPDKASRHLSSDNTKPPWAANWYQRWQVLTDLSQLEQNQKHAESLLPSPPLRRRSPSEQVALDLSSAKI